MKHFKKVVIILGILGACGGTGKKTSNSGNPIQTESSVVVDTSRPIRVYKGSELLKVVIVPVSGHPFANFLLEVQGSDGVADGMVWPVNLEKQEGRVDKAFRTKSRGESKGLLWHETSSYGGGWWKLSMPTDKEGVAWTRWGKETPVALDEDLGKTTKADGVLGRFQSQSADGSLAIRTEWNRKRREELIEGELAARTKKVNEACGTDLTSTVDWSSVDDEQLKTISVTSYCEDGLGGIENICKDNENVGELLEGTKTFNCQFSDNHGMHKNNGELVWSPSGTNHSQLAKSSAQALLGFNLQVAKAKNGLVMIMDTNEKDPKFYYGKDGVFKRQKMTWLYGGGGGGGVFDPGQRSTLKTGKTWSLKCGNTKVTFKKPSVDDKKALLKNVKLESYAFERQPDTLARDSRGVYYYVDRSIDDLGGKDFHVYIGKKGDMKKTALKDIVDDSEGKIFSTNNGKLRLLTGQRAVWISGKTNVKLKELPIDKNEDLIFNQLGAYDGQSLGSVCEDI